MSNSLLEFYETLGFEETEIEDGLVVLGIEFTAEGNYALLTDDEGTMPQKLDQAVIFAYYSPEDAFLWSASFKNSTVFKEIWTKAATTEDKLAAIINHRQANEVL